MAYRLIVSAYLAATVATLICIAADYDRAAAILIGIVGVCTLALALFPRHRREIAALFVNRPALTVVYVSASLAFLLIAASFVVTGWPAAILGTAGLLAGLVPLLLKREGETQ